jgi:hypothetical protein
MKHERANTIEVPGQLRETAGESLDNECSKLEKYGSMKKNIVLGQFGKTIKMCTVELPTS